MLKSSSSHGSLHGPVYLQEPPRRVGMTFQQEDRRRQELRDQEEERRLQELRSDNLAQTSFVGIGSSFL